MKRFPGWLSSSVRCSVGWLGVVGVVLALSTPANAEPAPDGPTATAELLCTGVMVITVTNPLGEQVTFQLTTDDGARRQEAVAAGASFDFGLQPESFGDGIRVEYHTSSYPVFIVVADNLLPDGLPTQCPATQGPATQGPANVAGGREISAGAWACLAAVVTVILLLLNAWRYFRPRGPA
jgi:hypothetical protein